MNNPSGSETIPGGSALGCDSTILVDLTFEPTVIATLSGNVQICPGETVELTVNFSEPGTFSIRYSDGVNAVLLNNIQDGHIIEVSPTTSTSYFIDLVIIPNSNCPAIIEGEALVEVSKLGINAEVSDYGGFEISCNGSADGFIDINATGGLNPISYAWNTGATTSGLSNLGPGTYSVLVADAAGCSAETTATLTEPEAMILENTVINPSCFGDGDGSITLESIQGGTPPFEYSFDGEFFQSVTGIPFTLNNLFGGNYTLHIQDANDCKTELEVDIPNPPQLIVDLGEDVEIRLGDSTALDAFVNFDVAGLVWTPTDDLSDPQNLKTFASPYFTTEYRLEVSDENGCTVTDAITVFVDRFLIAFSPTAFSPNGDGINDYFTLFGDSSVELIEELLIFDRWGNKLFVATEIPVNEESLGWDGKFQGKPMNVGVYVYYAVLRFVDGRTQVFKGDITLVK